MSCHPRSGVRELERALLWSWFVAGRSNGIEIQADKHHALVPTRILRRKMRAFVGDKSATIVPAGSSAPCLSRDVIFLRVREIFNSEPTCITQAPFLVDSEKRYISCIGKKNCSAFFSFSARMLEDDWVAEQE